MRLDLGNENARHALFEDLDRKAKRALVISEGLVIYLTRDEVGMLARDLAAPKSFQYWVLDLVSPGLLRMLEKNLGSPLTAAGSPLKFGPEEGPDFFLPYGWRPAQVESLLKTAARLKRLSFGMRLASMLPQSNGRQGSRPWGAMCLFAKR